MGESGPKRESDARVFSQFGPRRSTRPWRILFSVMLIGMGSAACAEGAEPLRGAGSAEQEAVRVRVPLPFVDAVPAVARALRVLIDTGWGGSFDIKRFRVYSMQAPPAPEPVQMRATAAGNPALLRYVDLPAAARAHDQFVYEPTTDYFWSSVYKEGSAPLPFRCAFIVHLEPAAADRSETTIAVLEYLPVARFGRKLSGSQHGLLPGLHHDQRVVGPTAREPQQLAAALAAALKPAR